MHQSTLTSCPRFLAAILIGCGVFLAGDVALAHCDSEKGPVIEEARTALEKGDAGVVLKWVKPEREAEIREALRLALEVRGKGGGARELADRWFVETVVRIHRAGEGATYTGIRSEPPAPGVLLADKALTDGNADAVTAELSKTLAAGIRTRHARVVEAAAHKDCCVDGGRAYVAAYVDYVHYVERAQAILAQGASGPAGEDRPTAAPVPAGSSDVEGAHSHQH